MGLDVRISEDTSTAAEMESDEAMAGIDSLKQQ